MIAEERNRALCFNFPPLPPLISRAFSIKQKIAALNYWSRLRQLGRGKGRCGGGLGRMFRRQFHLYTNGKRISQKPSVHTWRISFDQPAKGAESKTALLQGATKRSSTVFVLTAFKSLICPSGKMRKDITIRPVGGGVITGIAFTISNHRHAILSPAALTYFCKMGLLGALVSPAIALITNKPKIKTRQIFIRSMPPILEIRPTTDPRRDGQRQWRMDWTTGQVSCMYPHA